MVRGQQTIIETLNELIEKGEELKEIKFEVFGVIETPRMTFDNYEKYNQWKADALYLIKMLLGEKEHYREFSGIEEVYIRTLKKPIVSQAEESHRYYMATFLSILKNVVNIVKKGLLIDVKTLVASDVFESLLQEVDYLLSQKYKDCAAVLCRVVIEDTLKQLCDMNKIFYDPKDKASKLNGLLKKNDVYPTHIWREIQAKLDIGNYAAHGEFDKFTLEDVQEMYEWTKGFIEDYLA